MKNIKIISLLVLSISVPNISFAFRCGNDLVQKGNLKYQVSTKCGKPISKENIGHIDKEENGDRITVLKLEEWIYKKQSSHYRLLFEGSKLVEIETFR